jgi:hypothetical protein
MQLRGFRFLLAVLLLLPVPALAQNVEVVVDATAAERVLAAVRNPAPTMADALAIARLPGNQGLIRKARSYGRTADEALLARSLVAAAHRDAAFADPAKFRFDAVRDHAVETKAAMDRLNDPNLRLLDAVKARIAAFTPAGLKGQVTGYLIVGGTSGGFAFGEPRFYLNLDRFPSATLASTIMQHELYHAVQALARAARPAAAVAKTTACVAAVAHGRDVGAFFDSLSAEGTASYVGDVLALPVQGGDEVSAKERTRVARNVDMVDRSITQLELSVHGLVTGAAVTPEEVYALGFYGDEVLYALGYVMARAIAREQGKGALGNLIGLPGAAFVEGYLSLRSYGKSAEAPALKTETIRWARMLSACAKPQ